MEAYFRRQLSDRHQVIAKEASYPTPSKDYTSSCREKFKLQFPGKILECNSEGKDFHSSQKLFVVDVWPQKGP